MLRRWIFVQGLSLACLVGLLLFVKLDFLVELPICLLSLAAMCFCAGGVFQGLSLACLVGLLLFVKWDVFSRASHLQVVSGCHFLCRWIFSGPVTGLLGRPAAFREVGFLLVWLPVCLLSLAAIFVAQVDFCSGPVTGLLGRATAFREVGFFY